MQQVGPELTVDARYPAAVQRDRRPKARNLVNMSPELAEPWAPDLPADGVDFTQHFVIDETRSYVLRFSEDEYGRLVDFAVVQLRRNADGEPQRIALYDACHGKGYHLHLYNSDGREFDQHPLRPVSSYAELEVAYADAVKRVERYWQENERRSERGQ